MSVVIQPKFDGIRLVIHRRGNEIKIFTEDKKRNRARIVPDVVKEVKTLSPDQFIIDTEFVIWRNDEPIPREKMMSLVVGNDPVHEDIHVNVHDCLWYGDEGAINELPYIERLKYLDKLLPKDLKYLKKSPSWIINNRKEFDKALKKAYDYSGSEGAMAKSSDSQYLPSAARTVDWCIGGGTKIITIEGVREARFIEPGLFVLSKDGNYHRVLRKSVRLPGEGDRLFRLSVVDSDNYILITGNHEVLESGKCSNNDLVGSIWIKTEDLMNGHQVANPGNSRSIVEIRELGRANNSHMPLYDFEIEDEDSYCTPDLILHNSKIKIVKEVSVEIIGRLKKAMPFETIGRDQPKEDIVGEEARKLYKRLQEKSRTWIFRCALKDGKSYRTIDAQDTVTESDLEVRWNAGLTKPKWQGLDDPALWEMKKGFEHRKPGEQSYGSTYAKSFDIEPKLGMIVSVAPVQVIEFTGEDGKRRLSWMFPKVRELKPDREEADDIADLQHLIEVRKIQNIEGYDPRKANDSQLRDDFRISLAWYAKWKENPDAIKFTRQQIKDVLVKIMRELAQRGPETIKFSPERMKASSQEIFNEARKEVKIPAIMLKD